MSIIIVDNFQVNSERPIDNRFVVGPGQFYTQRSDITYKYTGLRVYDLNDSTFYYWNGTSWTSETFNGGGGDVSSAGSGIFSYIPRFTGGSTITISQIFDNTNNVGFGTTVFGSEKYKFAGGDVKIDGGSLKVDNGDTANPVYTFTQDDGTGIYYNTNNSSLAISISSDTNVEFTPTVALFNTPITITDPDAGDYSVYNQSGINSSYNYSISSATSLNLNSSGGQNVSINTGFKIESSGYALISNGTNVSPGLAFINSPSTGIYAPTNGQLGVSVNTYFKMIFSDNDIYANIHQAGLNGRGDSGNSIAPWNLPSIASGQFTSPLGQPIANCSGVLPSNYTWMRVGNVVNVSGSISFFISTSGTASSFRLNLPINSKFGIDLGGGDANSWQLNGVGKIRLTSGIGSQGDIASIEATDISGTGFALFKFRPSVSGSQYMTFTFTYMLGAWPNTPAPPVPPPPVP